MVGLRGGASPRVHLMHSLFVGGEDVAISDREGVGLMLIVARVAKVWAFALGELRSVKEWLVGEHIIKSDAQSAGSTAKEIAAHPKTVRLSHRGGRLANLDVRQIFPCHEPHPQTAREA